MSSSRVNMLRFLPNLAGTVLIPKTCFPNCEKHTNQKVKVHQAARNYVISVELLGRIFDWVMEELSLGKHATKFFTARLYPDPTPRTSSNFTWCREAPHFHRTKEKEQLRWLRLEKIVTDYEQALVVASLIRYAFHNHLYPTLYQNVSTKYKRKHEAFILVAPTLPLKRISLFSCFKMYQHS